MTGSGVPFRVVFWGTYDLGKPRTRILRDGLRGAGVEVIEIHADIWKDCPDKSQIDRGTLLKVVFKALALYPLLILRYLRAPRHDLVIVPYLGQVDVLVLWPFARLRRRPVVLDMFLSLTDTVVSDRRMTRAGSLAARLLHALEWLSCRAADRVLMDTRAHAAHVSELFDLPGDSVMAVAVGAEPGAFGRLPPPAPDQEAVRILFYGQLIPLHGIETILAAALSPRGRAHRWRLVGTGQMRGTVEEALAGGGESHIEWIDWLPYDQLRRAIEDSDICLGIFGSSRKAASVVPNKVFQALVAGRPVITRDSPAITETFASDTGLARVPHSDPEALLDAIDHIKAAGFPVMPAEQLAIAHPEEIGRRLCSEVLEPLARGRRVA